MVEHMGEMHAAMCKTASNPVWLRRIAILGIRELSLSVLAGQLRHPTPTESRHLPLMKAQGVGCSRRDGNAIYYRVADLRIFRAIALLRGVLLSRMKRENEYLSSG
jgi:DNA-binding transcriptional ArsR family regulator